MINRLIFFVLIVFFSGCGSQEKKKSFDPSTEVEEIKGFQDDPNLEDIIQTYEDPDRGNWQNPELVIKKLGDISNKTIADIGAGTGYFTFKIASEAKKVIAIDIEEKFLEYIEERKAEFPEDLGNKIETRLSKTDDPLLKKKEIDIALVVNTYPFIPKREMYFRKVKDALKGKGFLVIVDFKMGDIPVGPETTIKVPVRKVRDELYGSGFKTFEIDTTSLQYQYIIKAK